MHGASPILADMSPSRLSVLSYRSESGHDHDVAQLQQQLHSCRLDLAETSAERQRLKTLLENEREEATLRRDGAAAAAQQQIARAEAKAVAHREQADAALSALASAKAKLREAESWRDKAQAHEQSLSISEHAHQISEAKCNRALAETEALQARADSANQAHEKMSREHADELRAERHRREQVEQHLIELERSRDGAEINASTYQESLNQAQAAHAEAIGQISTLRASLDAASEESRKHEANAHAWEERAHAAIAEATRRGHQGTAAGSATVALLTSDIASTKQLLHAERASKAEFASELATERNGLEAALAQAKHEREVALDAISAAREEADASARLAAEHIKSGTAAQQTSELQINALRSELVEVRADARRHAAAISSVKTAAGASEARVQADADDLRRCLRVAEETSKVHAKEASGLELRNGQLQHRLALLEAKHQAAEDQVSTLSKENSKLQEDVKKLIAQDRNKDLERSTVDSSMRRELAQQEATILRLEGQLETREIAIAKAAEERTEYDRALVDAEKRLAKQEQARIQSETQATAALERAAISAHENTSETVAELSERVLRLHDELHKMHNATAVAEAEHKKMRTEEAELAGQWQLRITAAEAARDSLKARVEQLANETAETKTAAELAEHDSKMWKRRAELAIDEAGAAHSELAEFGAELQMLHSLHKQSVSEHKAEGKRLRSEVSVQGAEAERKARTATQLEIELHQSEQKHELMAARAEQSAQYAFALEMRAAQVEAEELVRRTKATAEARHRAEDLSGLLSAQRSPLQTENRSPSPTQKQVVSSGNEAPTTYREARQRKRQAASRAAIASAPGPVISQARQPHAYHDVSSAAAVVSGTIGQHLGHHSRGHAYQPLTSGSQGGVVLRGTGTSSHRHNDSIASLLESPGTSLASYSPEGVMTPARSEDDHETTFGVLSMLEGLEI
eukprot:COSAG02_NODE_1345_length_13143_cov_61.223091_10_plen_934_part_00